MVMKLSFLTISCEGLKCTLKITYFCDKKLSK